MSFRQFLVLKTGTEVAAAEFYDHVDIVSRYVAAADITEVFIFTEIRADIFRHFLILMIWFLTSSGGGRHRPPKEASCFRSTLIHRATAVPKSVF
jgi:hypothetical protein